MKDGVNRCARSLDGRERMKRTYDEPVTPQNWAMRSSLIFDFDLDCGGGIQSRAVMVGKEGRFTIWRGRNKELGGRSEGEDIESTVCSTESL